VGEGVYHLSQPVHPLTVITSLSTDVDLKMASGSSFAHHYCTQHKEKLHVSPLNESQY
jgi:hypothetical protein